MEILAARELVAELNGVQCNSEVLHLASVQRPVKGKGKGIMHVEWLAAWLSCIPGAQMGCRGWLKG